MMNKACLILAAKQKDMMTGIKAIRNMYIDSILTVFSAEEIENKLDRQHVNIILWDLDEFRLDRMRLERVRSRYTVHMVYTSLLNARYSAVNAEITDEFILKPAIFTNLTAQRFCAQLEKHISNFVKNQRPPSMRDLVKMVSLYNKQKIVVIGSSTGGTNALEDMLKVLPRDIPPMVVVQHMPSGFTKLFADRLNAICKQDIREARSGDFLMRGRMLIAPAEQHIKIVKFQNKLAVECFAGTRIHGVMPAADILFESVAEAVKSEAVGVILTGMGSDGAKGLLRMKNAGCINIGQDEATCVVYGMPKAAKTIGAIHYELPLDKIPDMILSLAGKGG